MYHLRVELRATRLRAIHTGVTNTGTKEIITPSELDSTEEAYLLAQKDYLKGELLVLLRLKEKQLLCLQN